ncbi:hypothetical protein J2Y56_003929 [Pseudomonas sp. BE134]|nr:hypothetical protein [Pseudomonas sp. BE134]
MKDFLAAYAARSLLLQPTGLVAQNEMAGRIR